MVRFRAAGTTITYHYLVTNLGNVTLEPITVTDDLPGLSPVTCPSSGLAPRASTTCTAHFTTSRADLRRRQILNTGLAAGGAPNGVTVKARTHLVTVGPATTLAMWWRNHAWIAGRRASVTATEAGFVSVPRRARPRPRPGYQPRT